MANLHINLNLYARGIKKLIFLEKMIRWPMHKIWELIMDVSELFTVIANENPKFHTLLQMYKSNAVIFSCET